MSIRTYQHSKRDHRRSRRLARQTDQRRRSEQSVQIQLFAHAA